MRKDLRCAHELDIPTASSALVAEASSIDLRSVHEIWDNRATMHRARPFDDTRYRREMRRVTTLDIEPSAVVPSAS